MSISSSLRVSASALLLLLAFSFHALGQESTPPTSGGFEKDFEAWKRTVAEMRATQLKYRAASEGERVALQERFAELTEQGQKQLDALAQSAEAAYVAAPGKDPSAMRLLLLATNQAFVRHNYEEVVRQGQLLTSNAADVKNLHSLIAAAAYATNNYDMAREELKAQQAEDEKYSKELEEFFGAPTFEAAFALIDEQQEHWQIEEEIRDAEAKADDLPRVKLETSQGDVVIELFENEAPNTVANFLSLVEKGFYNGVPFHRVLQHFMAQGGDPTGSGAGGPGYTIDDELDPLTYRRHFRGSLSMAHAGANTGGSQFFITFKATPHLNGKHTVFGRVIEGMANAGRLRLRDPEKSATVIPDTIVKATVMRKRDHDYTVEKNGNR